MVLWNGGEKAHRKDCLMVTEMVSVSVVVIDKGGWI